MAARKSINQGASKTKTSATKAKVTRNVSGQARAKTTKDLKIPPTLVEDPTKPASKRRKRKPSYDFEVTFSFAGEIRKYVESVNTQLKRGGVITFYDYDHQAKLAGENLFELLTEIYKDKARFCAMFISKHYVEKPWTKVERQAAQARAFESQETYIIPIRLDETEVPGVLKTTGYIDARGKPPREVMKLLKEKLMAARVVNLPKKGNATPSKSTSSSSNTGKGTQTKTKTSTVVPAPGAFTHLGQISASGNWLLLDGEFYRASSVKPEGALLIATIPPRDADEEARLEAFDSRRNSYRSYRQVAYAHGNKAFSVSVEGVDSPTERGKTVCVLKLRPNANPSVANSGLGGWADEGVQSQARAILLNEAPSPKASLGSSSYFASSAKVDGVFPPLWRRLQGRRMQSADVLRCARLEALYRLKSDGVVEHISTLTLSAPKKGVLNVRFKGSRPERYRGQGETVVEFSGKCELSRG